MRLLVVSHAADRTGAPLSALALLRAFAARDGIEVRALLRRDGPLRAAYEAAAPTDVWRVSPHFSLADLPAAAIDYDPLMALKCLRNPDRPYCLSADERAQAAVITETLRDWGPTAIYANTTHAGDVVEALGLDAPVVTHVRELAPTIRALDPRRRRFALERTALFIAVSKGVAADLAGEFGVDPAKIIVEPPAVEMAPASPAEAAARAAIENAYALAPQDRLVVGAGTVGRRKGADLFYEAARAGLNAWKGDAGRLVFVWLGDGDMRAELAARARHDGLEKVILFPGATRDPLSVFRRASVLMMTSREDPFPRVAIEAAACGVRVLTFESGGAVDMVEDEGVGALVSGFASVCMG